VLQGKTVAATTALPFGVFLALAGWVGWVLQSTAFVLTI
jgi:prepilin signal peptidase PulO-like enzyme (type II secretory pathway)